MNEFNFLLLVVCSSVLANSSGSGEHLAEKTLKFVDDAQSELHSNLGTYNGETPILTDLHRHYITVFKASNKDDAKGKILLHFAVELDMLDVVEFLVKKGVSIEAEDNRGWTPLHVAADNGYLNITKYLISNGAQIKEKTKDNQTVLHIDASKGYAELVKFHIEHGAMQVLEDKDANGKSALDIATEKNNTAVVEILEKAAKQQSLNKQLLEAAKKGDLEIVKHLIQEGADLNLKDNDGMNALHWASWFGHLNVTEYFVEVRGMDVYVKTNIGKTVLHLASQNGQLNMVKYLVEEKGMDVNVNDYEGSYALHYASFKGHLEVVKYLINERGMNVNVKNIFGKTVLHLASENGQLNMVKYLVEEKGMDVNAKNNQLWTALHSASWTGKLDVVKYLTEKNADIDVKDKFGDSSLDDALIQGYTEVAKWLKDKGGKAFTQVDKFNTL